MARRNPHVQRMTEQEKAHRKKMGEQLAYELAFIAYELSAFEEFKECLKAGISPHDARIQDINKHERDAHAFAADILDEYKQRVKEESK